MKRHTAQRSVQRYALTAIVVTVVLILFAGCGKAKPTATPVPTDVPPTLGQAQDKAATPTPIPPTSTATQTPIPPTPTATPAQTPTPKIPIETVNFVTEDGVKLVGSLVGGEGQVAVILGHMWGAGRGSWLPFAKLITTKGFTAFIFDFRGFGASEGYRSYSAKTQDVQAAVELLHERGYERIVCMGASMGGTGCVEAALLGADFEGVGVISGEIKLTTEQAATLTMPKFLATEEGAPENVEEMESAHELLPEPKTFKVFPGSAHGTNLFHSVAGDEFRQMLLAFLEGLHSPTAALTAPAPEIPIETVSLVAEDGVKLAGNLVGGEGKVAVILTHMMGSNRVSWLSFAKLITTKGFTALIFDFRGYGASEGKFSYSQPPKDVLTAVEFLHERGYERIICMGASIGGTACVEAALLGADFEGVGVISGEINLTAEQAATLTMPKFLATEEDAPQSAIDQMASAHELLPEPKAFEIIPSSAHGTDLLKSSVGDEFRQMLLDFLQGL